MVDKSNTVTAAVLKELGVQKGSGFPKLEKVGNVGIEQLIKVAKAKMNKVNAYDLKNAVKTVSGVCVSIGVLCESMHPKDFAKKVDSGVYDKEINAETVTISKDKKEKLAKELAEFNTKAAADLAELKKKVEAKAAKEAAMKAGGAAPGAAPAPAAAGAKPGAPATGAKPAAGPAPAAGAKSGAAPATGAKPGAPATAKKEALKK